MAIKLEMTGICKDCPKAELVLEPLEIGSFDTTIDKHWDVYCTHEDACERILKVGLKPNEPR